jgi:hypothetical protein
MWGVRSLSVEGAAPDEPSDEELLDPEVRAAAEARVAVRFSLLGEELHPFLRALHDEALSEAARDIARGRR